MTRRQLIAACGAAGAAAAAPAAGPRFIKGICSNIFPAKMPLEECFRKAKDAGFDAIEVPSGGEVDVNTDPAAVRRLGDAARAAGVAIASLWVSQPLSANPLNSPDAAVRAKGVEAVKKLIEHAALLGAGAMLVVPGRLGSGAKFQYGYQDTWDRVTAEMRKLVPFAQKAKVILTPENVWNKFLVSPLEMRAFVDQFKSPWIGTHFDTGNIMQYGYPQDWILTLGPRIKRVHVKDYKLSARAEQGRFVDLLEGDVDWKETMAALVKVGYRGFISPEIGYDRNDPDQLKKVSGALDKILALA
jgi:hexulose-6-phosphate isomerase